MSTFIVYASTHGFTEMCAQRIARQIPGDVELVDLTTHPHPDLKRAGVVIVGGSIHMSSIQPAVSSFCDYHQDSLLRHPLALFMTCMKRDEEAAQQFDNAFPLRLRAHAFATAHLGGAFYFDRMSMLQRWIVRKVTGIHQTTEDLDSIAMEDFTARLSTRVLQLRDDRAQRPAPAG